MRASTSASWSTIGPREVLTRTAPGGHQGQPSRVDQVLRLRRAAAGAGRRLRCGCSSSSSSTSSAARGAEPGRGRAASLRRPRPAGRPPRRSPRSRPGPTVAPCSWESGRSKSRQPPPRTSASSRPQVAQRRQHQRQRVVGDGLVVGARRRRHHHPRAAGRLEVDRVEPDPGAGDHPQGAGAGEHLGVEGVGVGDRRDRVAEHRRQLLRAAVVAARRDLELEPSRAQGAAGLRVVDGEAAVGDDDPPLHQKASPSSARVWPRRMSW